MLQINCHSHTSTHWTVCRNRATLWSFRVELKVTLTMENVPSLQLICSLSQVSNTNPHMNLAVILVSWIRSNLYSFSLFFSPPHSLLLGFSGSSFILDSRWDICWPLPISWLVFLHFSHLQQQCVEERLSYCACLSKSQVCSLYSETAEEF